MMDEQSQLDYEEEMRMKFLDGCLVLLGIVGGIVIVFGGVAYYLLTK